MGTEKIDETLEETGVDVSPCADTLKKGPPLKREKTVRGQLLKLAVALVLILLVSAIFFYITQMSIGPTPPLPCDGYGLLWTFADGRHTIEIAIVGKDIPESEKNIDILWLDIWTRTYTHFNPNWESCLLEPTPLNDLDTVENVSFVDVEPYGLLSIGDRIIIRNSFFNTSGRYSVRVGFLDPETGKWPLGGFITTLEVTV